MELLDRIEDQVISTGLPLFAITLAAVPWPDTPIILTLHWHAFIKEKLTDDEQAETVAYTSIPSSALQLNERWRDLLAVDRAAMDAAWELGAWDVQRAERRAYQRPGAEARETRECLQAFGAFPYGLHGSSIVIADAPDADELVQVASRHGYLMWLFRPVRGGIWGEYADDSTLDDDGRREPPCPLMPIRPTCDGNRKTVYRFGVPTTPPVAASC